MIAGKTENNVLTLTFEEQIDAVNALAAEEEIFRQCRESECDKVTLDCRNLKKVSGSFLRILMKLSKTMNNNISAVNVSAEVFESLDYSGFTNLIAIQRS